MTTTVGQRIERLRKLAGLSARELDALAGLRAGHCRAIEVGPREQIAHDTVRKIAWVLGVTTDWLGSGEGPAPPKATVRESVARAQRRSSKSSTA